MSNNLVSQPLSVPNNQMDPVPSKLEVSIPDMQMGMMGGISSCPTPQQFEMSNKRIGSVDSMSNNMGLHNSSVLNRQIGQMEGSQLYLMPNHQIGDMEGMWNNLGSQKISLPSKRRTMEEPTFINSAGQQLSMPNKNVAQIETFTNSPGLQQLPSWPNKRTIQVHSKSATPGSQNLPAQNKKMVRNESLSGRSGTKQLQTPKNRTTQMEPSPKAKSDSCESVRSKMRESLGSALALVTQGQDKASNEECNSDNGVGMTLQQTQGNPQQPESASVIADAADHVSDNPTDSLPSKGPSSVDKTDDVRSTSHGIFTNESAGDSPQSWKVGQEVQCDTVFPNEDVSFTDSFFVKDELLQGNGLTWAWDLDVDMGETKEEHTSKKPKLANEDAGGEGRDQAVQSPQSVAFKIEAELFKLFGGVNKKYRERGRSLLFNLKDRNNPELRERVMSGEIPPARLCSMTAEELASKELSQWRIAKAEELAQMVVLPDLDVDIRRLVKKTHKGEFQVEFEQDDGVQVEVSVGTSLLTRGQSKNEDTDAHPPATADEIKDKETNVGERGSLENQDPSYSLTIPSDGTDLMQGLMVDEFKDADFLPPIVSLDEFMESLDAEPPFENLPVDGVKTISPSSKESSESGNEITASEVASKEPVDTTPEKSDKVEVKHADSAMKTASKEVKSNETKSRETPIEPKPSPPGAASKGDYVWEGILQLNVSTLVTVVGFFRSGEKISTKDWPSSLEIKGRVRLDPFEKFVQGLPMSRSRAVMIVHFALKEGSSEIDHARLGEVTKSYVSDEKLGFAEAAPGVEIYFCPPHPKIVGILTKNLTKHHSENLISTMENGLIGVIVWRRPHLSSSSAISPNSNTNSSPHQKPSSKRHHHHHQQFPSRKHPEKDVKVNFPSKQTRPDDDVVDDDIPPGFGPAVPRDEDDLPEFNFSGASNLPPLPNSSVRIPSRGSNPAAPSRPVDHIRELIQKYGQSGNDVDSRNNVGRIGIQPWNDDDDDDDIPEWQPQAPPRQHLPPPQLPVYQTPMQPQFEAARAMAMARQLPVVQVGTPAAALPSQPPLVGMVQGGGGARWAQPPGPQDQRPSGLGSQPRPFYGVRAGPTAGMDQRRHGGGRK